MGMNGTDSSKKFNLNKPNQRVSCKICVKSEWNVIEKNYQGLSLDDFVANKSRTVTYLMHDTLLYLGFRIYRAYRVNKPGKPIDARYQYIIYTSVFDFVHHTQPKLRALVFAYP